MAEEARLEAVSSGLAPISDGWFVARRLTVVSLRQRGGNSGNRTDHRDANHAR